jgi:hypothetical protein
VHSFDEAKPGGREGGPGDDQAAEAARLRALGAIAIDVGQGDDVPWTCLADQGTSADLASVPALPLLLSVKPLGCPR